jgi:hypothetical protein
VSFFDWLFVLAVVVPPLVVVASFSLLALPAHRNPAVGSGRYRRHGDVLAPQ